MPYVEKVVALDVVNMDAVSVWMLYCLGCGCTQTPGHYGCPTCGPTAAQWCNFDVSLWISSGGMASAQWC